MTASTIYCIDTSSLIEASTRYYPSSSFPSLWVRLETLINDGRLCAPEEVQGEIAKQDDYLKEWGRAHHGLFVPLDQDQMGEASRIVATFERLVDTVRNRSAGDPWVIALAKLKGYTIVTQERKAPSKIKIPDVCEHYGLDYISLIELIRREKWTF